MELKMGWDSDSSSCCPCHGVRVSEVTGEQLHFQEALCLFFSLVFRYILY